MNHEERYLVKNISGLYHFRRRVPLELKQYVQRCELCISLRTRNYREAKARCRRYADESDRVFQELKERYGTMKQKDIEWLIQSAIKMPRAEMKVTDFRVSAAGGLHIGMLELDPDKEETEMRLYQQLVNTSARLVSSLPAPGLVSPSVSVMSPPMMPYIPDMTQIANLKKSANEYREKSCQLSELVELYITDRKESNKWKVADPSTTTVTETMNRGTFDLFEEIFGNKPVHLYTLQDAGKYRTILKNIPAAWKRQKETRHLSYEEACRFDGPKLKDSTVNDYIVRMTAIFNFAVDNAYCDRNIFNSVTIVKVKRNNRDPWTAEALHFLFKPANFFKLQRTGFASHYWAPLIAAYTGMRRSEIFFLNAVDIEKSRDGFWVISVNDIDRKILGNEASQQQIGVKTLKTETSIRKIPIHNDLLALGFLNYVEKRLTDKKNPRLFPEYKARRGQAGHDFSNVFGDWIRESANKLSPEVQARLFPTYLGMHAFRHLFIYETREQRIDENMSRRLAGHAVNNDAHDKYGGAISTTLERELLSELNTAVQKMKISSYLPEIPKYVDLIKGVF